MLILPDNKAVYKFQTRIAKLLFTEPDRGQPFSVSQELQGYQLYWFK
jgi:hypothetical protein